MNQKGARAALGQSLKRSKPSGIRGHWLFLACLLGGLASGSSFGQDSSQGKPQTSESSTYVSQTLNKSAPLSARVVAYQSLLRLKSEDRVRGLLALLSSDDYEFAAMSGSQLIRSKAANISQLVIQQIPKWPESSVVLVLQAVKEAKDEPALLEIPRRVVSLQMNRPANAASNVHEPAAALMAAAILARNGTASDKDIVRRLIVQNPHANGSWLILLEALPPDEAAFTSAMAVYRDPKVPVQTRVLAAAVAAKKEQAAAEFVVKETSSFIARYRNQEAGALLKAAYSSDTGKTEYLAFENQLILVCSLRYLNTEAAAKLTLNALDSTNLLIRVAAGLAAAIRWPERLLETQQGKFSEDEYVKILAFMLIKHPALAGNIMQKNLDRKAFGVAVRRLREEGATSVFPIGTFLSDY